jgi:Fic-DOC domain mobile mystery protein B
MAAPAPAPQKLNHSDFLFGLTHRILSNLLRVYTFSIDRSITNSIYYWYEPSRRQAPFTLKWVNRLHHEMFGRVWLFAGKPRRKPINIGIAAHQIDMQLQSLLDDLIYWRDHKTYSVFEQAARLHHRAVQIHPFENGNGRWSRMLADIWLKQNGESIIQWPDEMIADTSVIRDDYIRAVKSADNGDYEPLIHLHKKYTKET